MWLHLVAEQRPYDVLKFKLVLRMATGTFGLNNLCATLATLLAVFLIINIQSATQHKALAQTNPIYFGEPRECELYDPVACPPGTTEDSGFCRPFTSEFCNVFTGNSSVGVVNYEGRNRPVCTAAPKLGFCTQGTINYSPPSSISGIPRDFISSVGDLIRSYNLTNKDGFFAGESSAGNEQRLPDIDPSDTNIMSLLFNGDKNKQQPFRVQEYGTNSYDRLKNYEFAAVACLDGQDGRQRITVPITESLNKGNWGRDYDGKVIEMGFVLPKPSQGNFYCRDRSDIAFVADADDIFNYKCSSSIVEDGRGCVVRGLKTKDDEGNQDKSFCYSDRKTLPVSTNPNSLGHLVLPTPAGYRPIGSNVTLTIRDVDSTFCRQNAKDIFSLRSNKGCSDFVIQNAADNTLSEDSQGRYRECAKCLYGDPAILGTVEEGNLAISSGTVNDGDPITPYNEPLAKPIAGRLYTDLGGCINASSTGSVVNTIVRVALGVMGGIVILRIIQGALTMQKGDPEGFQEGRDVITSALIGLLLLIFSAALLNFLGINILGLDVTTFGS